MGWGLMHNNLNRKELFIPSGNLDLLCFQTSGPRPSGCHPSGSRLELSVDELALWSRECYEYQMKSSCSLNHKNLFGIMLWNVLSPLGFLNAKGHPDRGA